MEKRSAADAALRFDCISKKRVLDFSSTPLYNLLRKVIGCVIRLPSVV